MGYLVTMPNTLGQEMKRARLAKGWSIRQLNRESGIAIGTIRRIEQGKSDHHDHTLARLADVLGVEIGPYLDGSEEAS